MQPTLNTARLILRPLEATDAEAIQRLAGEFEVAKNTASIPHPYPDGAAEAWIAAQTEGFRTGNCACFAIVERATGELVGTIGFNLVRAHQRAELGYFIGVPYWNRGYATEAAAEMLRYGFQTLELHRITAGFFARNPASGRVMEKIGMQQEGRLCEHFVKWGQPLDVIRYGVLRRDWEAFFRSPPPASAL